MPNTRGGSTDATLPLIATDDVGGVAFQQIKLDVGGAGLSVPVVGTLPVSGTVTANAGTNLNTSALALDATLGTTNTEIGGVTETAPATDTASSGINGRLQRIAQRLTSLIGLLPSALGAGGGLKVDGSGTALPVSGTVTATVGTVTAVTSITNVVHVDDNAGSLTVDAPVGTPVFTRLSDGSAALVGQKAMSASLPVTIASDQGAVPASQSGTWTVQPGNTANTTAWKVDASSVAVPVTDNSGSLTVDAPVATPVFVRLSDGAAAIATLPVSVAATLSENIAQVNGATVNVGTGAAGTGTQRVTTSTDSTIATITNAVTVAQSTATSLKAQAETYQGGVAVGTANPLYVTPYDTDLGLPAGMNALRDALVAQRYTVLADSVADGLASFWAQATANGGSIVVSVGEGLLQTSANATGSAQMVSTPVTYYPGQVSWFNSAIRLNDTGSAGNTRRWGAFTTIGNTPNDGYYYELNGTTLNAVSCKAGVATTVASTAWTKVATNPFTLDTNYHQFEIRYTANSVQFLIDNVLRHTASGGASSITQTLNFPIAIQTVNTSGATERTIAVRNVGIGRFGTPDVVRGTSGAVDASPTAPQTTDLVSGWDGLNVRSAFVQAIDGHNTLFTHDQQLRRLIELMLIEQRITNAQLARMAGSQAPTQIELEPGHGLVN